MNETASRITIRPRLYLTPKDAGRRLTLEQFQSAGSLEGHKYELIHGRLEVSPIPNLPHDLRSPAPPEDQQGEVAGADFRAG